ncbi:Up-regulated during septation-domain-containing protein [Chaetomium sp. MPI-CAGE-AT-0009]|nr:Up-regulated during septation-domain-containing protein [Chaetomium sp. MPI-CAGE-AT-0009]
MAHIANCLEIDQEDLSIGLNNYIAAKTVTEDSNEPLGRSSPSGDKPFAWRMQHPERKYQLFPKDKQTAAAPGKALDPEQAQAYALTRNQNGEKSEKMALNLRVRIKEREMRNRKISISDPLTTVQEAAMDSPTIPGRPPVHERSISAPGSSWKPYSLGDCMSSGRTRTPPAERPELRSAYRSNEELQRPEVEPRQPLSPKSLAPLVIPTSNPIAPHLARRVSISRLRSGSTPVEGPTRAARADDSPRARTPFTPLSASLTTPRSAATTVMTASTLATPISAPADHRESPRPWEKSTNQAATGAAKEAAPERSETPRAELNDPLQRLAFGHRRNQSESDSMINRGRPPRRLEGCAGPTLKRSGSKRNKSSEGHAIEQLPRGWKASDAVNILNPQEVASLQRQAVQQAARFEVLRKEDVFSLSQELRLLDERTDYLRHTYTSLRSGRRNLHTRICQYLRSPRTAKFSHESILKQEEALAELDTSIDEWVSKLEHAENRRTRVRQKLLEHVAAAATLGAQSGSVVGVSESLQFALGVVRPHTADLSTPPRSPVKPSFTPAAPPPSSSSSSPHRAHVPSTILEQPLFEEAAAMDTKEAEKGAALRRAETIRVYAHNDVYALLADVEDTITKMGSSDAPAKDKDSCTPLSEVERRKLCRTHSHDVLSGGSVARKPLPISKLAEKPSCSSLYSSSISSSSQSSTKTPATSEPATGEVFLTSAVFKP